MPFLSEDLERGVEAHLQTSLPAQLAAVEARWASTEPVTLPAPATWERGYRSDIIERASSYFPLVVTMFPTRAPQGSPFDTGHGQTVYAQGSISAFVVADTEAQAHTIALRYTEALVAAVQSKQVVAGHRLHTFEPATREYADTGPHLKNGETGDAYLGKEGDDFDYMRLVELTLEYEVL